MPRTSPKPEETKRVTVLPGKTFRGTLFFEEADFDVSPVWADFLIEQGIAKDAEWKDAPRPQGITFKAMQQRIRAMGCTVRGRDGEIRVNLSGGTEATAYYTDDREDAVRTADAMSRRAHGVL